MSFGLAASPRVNAVLTASDKTNKARGPRAAIPAVVLLHAAGEQEDFRPLFLPGPPALVLWSGAVPRGCPSPTCDKMRRFVSAENPCRPGRPRDGDFSAAARNSSQVLAHSRVTLLFFRPRLGEMLQDAGQPQHGGRAGRVLRPGPRLAIGTTRFCAAQHVFRGEGGPRRQAGPAARGQISPQATDIAINSSKETD